MEQNYFKDKLFDILNESGKLPIADIQVDDKNNLLFVWMEDGSGFSIRTQKVKLPGPALPSNI